MAGERALPSGARQRSTPAEAISRAEAFLRAALARGHCSDFRTPVGESNEWVTAYVAGSLRPTRENADVRARAAQFLLSRQRWSGGWGYNHLCPADADSTAAALRFLASGMGVSPSKLNRAAGFLVAHIEPGSGAMRTYRRTLGLRLLMRAWQVRFEGWQMAHACVTAAAGEALGLCGERQDSVLTGLADFLAAAQRSDGSWIGYWWDDALYATALALSFMAGSGQLPKLRHDPSAWLSSTQRSDGSWCAPCTQSSSPFATALALKTLDIVSRGQSPAIPRARQWLVEHQRDDGSWMSVPIMRIPHPFDRQPERQRHWRIDQLGTGVLIHDQHRLFTTATVMRCLAGARSGVEVFAPHHGPAD